IGNHCPGGRFVTEVDYQHALRRADDRRSRRAAESGEIPKVGQVGHDKPIEASDGKVRSQYRKTMTHRRCTNRCHGRSGSRQRAVARSVRARMIAFRNSSNPASAGSTGRGYDTCGKSTNVTLEDVMATVVGWTTDTVEAGIPDNGGAERIPGLGGGSGGSVRRSTGGFDGTSGVATATAGSGAGMETS